MTENSKKIFEVLKKNYGKEFSKHELVERLDIPMSAVSGSINGLLMKNYAVERVEIAPSRFKGDKIAEIRYVQLTEEGYKFDPDEAERQKAQARLEAAAARKEARRLEKEERARKNSVL